jgi:hypothetical protein
MISYRLGDIDGMWVASLLIEIPFMTLRVALRHRGLKFHLHRTDLHACMIQMFGSLVMTWLHIHFSLSRMTCHSMILIHPLIHTLLRMHVLFMRILNHYTQIFRITMTWMLEKIGSWRNKIKQMLK